MDFAHGNTKFMFEEYTHTIHTQSSQPHECVSRELAENDGVCKALKTGSG